MLRSNKAKKFEAGAGRFVIIASKYNARYVDAMIAAAQATLKDAGVSRLKIVRVPGAFEIPVVAAKIANNDEATSREKQISAIICLGVILRGQTVHAEHIGRAVSDALMTISLQHQIPVIHEVLLLENEEQARVRCLDKKFNRGAEAAQTALEMALVMANCHL
ncbi:MAG TPA: 6,7-dimethyl-8-ribityllumazine synthase [Verrucomicrobiae bacterium]|nr:6,7-dimethyl-8-ribityllumazine synthase [Verrucomicrobiae bacterium]